MKLPKVELNWLDKAIAFVNPAKGIERFRAKQMLAIAGGYTGASKSRRSMTEWKTTGNSADGDILPDLATLRERSRDLARNNPLAAGAINTKVTNVVGTGLKLQARVDQQYLGMSDQEADEWQKNTEREFKLWADTVECDMERSLTFCALQELAFRSVLENGDIFTLLPFVSRGLCPYGLKIQLIEADRVSNSDNQPDTDKIAGGIEKDEFGAPVAYHILTTHPGDMKISQRKWVVVPAFGVKSGQRKAIHLFRKLRPGQSRGVPDLAPVIEAIKQLGTYTDAEIMAAVISSMFTVFVKSDSAGGLAPMEPTMEMGGKVNDKDYKLGAGAILDLLPGESVETANPGRPNPAFDPFIMAILRQIGVALELPFEILVKHFTASYSAARAAMNEAWKFFSARRTWLAENFCQPVYEAWLTEAVALGRINAPGFLSGDPAIRQAYVGAEWIGPARGQLDELKEIKAAQARVDMGVSTLAEETAQMTGGDWEIKHRQRAKEVKMRLEDGLLAKPDQNQVTDSGDNTND